MRDKTTWHKPLANLEDYATDWNWTVAHSKYHFDNSIKEEVGDWFYILGIFEGDWRAERDALVAASMAESRKILQTSQILFSSLRKNLEMQKSPMLTQEEYDIAQHGGELKALMLTNKVDDLENFPTLYAMADYFGITGDANKGAKKRAHVQLTGQMFNLHIDKLWDRCPEDPERVGVGVGSQMRQTPASLEYES